MNFAAEYAEQERRGLLKRKTPKMVEGFKRWLTIKKGKNFEAFQNRCSHCIAVTSDGPDFLCSHDRKRVLRVWGADFRFPSGRPPPSPQESYYPPVQINSDHPPKSPPSHPCWADEEDFLLPPKRRVLLPTPPWRPIFHSTPTHPIIRRGPLLPTPVSNHPNIDPIPELLSRLQSAKEELIELMASQPGWGKRWQ